MAFARFGGDDFFNDTYIEDFDDESESVYLDTFNEDESSLNTNQSEADHDHELKTVEELVGADLPHDTDNAYNKYQSSVWCDNQRFCSLLTTQNTNNCGTLHDVNKVQDKTGHLKGFSSEQHFDQNTLRQPLAQNTHHHHDADSDTASEETLRNISLNSANFWHATQQTCFYNENASLEFKDQIQRSVRRSQSEQSCEVDFGFLEDDSSEDSNNIKDSDFVLEQHFGAMNLDDNLFSKGENTAALMQHSSDVTEIKSCAAILKHFSEQECNMHLYKISETSTNNEATLHVNDEDDRVDFVDETERGCCAAGIIHSLHPVLNTPGDRLTASEMDESHQEDDVRDSSSPFGSLEPLFTAKLSLPLLPVTCVSVLSHNNKHISDETNAQESNHIYSSGQMHQASISSGKNFADNELLAQFLTPDPLDPADITEDHVKYLLPLNKKATGTQSHLEESYQCWPSHPEKQCSVVGSTQKPNILQLLTQSSVSTLSSSWPSDLHSELQIQDQTETEMTKNVEIFTRTEMFDEAYDALFNTELHRVVILGMPSSGKGTLGRALLRAGKKLGMEPHIIKSFEEWRDRIGGRATGESCLIDGLPGPSQSSPQTPVSLYEIVPQSQIVLLEHIFGYEFLQIDLLSKWRQVFSLIETFCSQKKVYLVLIVNCHVLKALREGFCEVQTLFPLQCDVEMKSPNPEEKEKMLLLYLKNEVQPQRLSKLINDKLLKPVIACDESKSLFPGCCQRFVRSINTYVPPQNPSADNFKCHVSMCGKIFSRPAPIFTAFVLKVWHMMENSQIILLAAFSLLLAHKDVDNADIVLDFCTNHKLMDSHFSPHSLKPFLLRFRGTLVKDDCKDFVNRHAYEGTALALAKYHASLVISIVGWPFLIKRCIVPLQGTRVESYLKPYVIEVKQEKAEEYKALTQRIARSLQNKDEMILAVQHPALSIIEFREDVQKDVTDGILSNLRDGCYSQTALFWSLFNSRPHFTDFILKKCGPHKKEDLVTAALACCVLRGKVHTLKTFVKYWYMVTKENRDLFLLGKKVEKRILPLPKCSLAISDDWRNQLKHLKYPVSNTYGVSEIDASLPPLHLAVQYNNLDVVNFLMEEHPKTLCVLDLYERSVLHIAARFSVLEVVRVLLQKIPFRPLISLCDQFGNTPLHDACYSGHVEIVKILSNACRDWKTVKNRSNLTAVDLALSQGHSDIASLLK